MEMYILYVNPAIKKNTKCKKKMFACIFSKCILFRISSFSHLVILAFFNNLNIGNSGANFIYFLSIILYLKSNMLMKFGILCPSSISTLHTGLNYQQAHPFHRFP